jgi:hypothetical protein
MKFIWMLDQRNMLVFALTVRGALEAPEAAKIISPLVKQCQKALNDILTKHSVGLFWVPGRSRVCGNEIASKLARDGTVHQFVGHELALRNSRQNIRKKIKCWMDNQHMAMWRGLICTQRQALKLILGPILTRPGYCPLTEYKVVLLPASLPDITC